MNPLVSVVVTTYNQAAYIEDTLKSALAQTYTPREVIVVDDGSTDDTPARIAAFGEQVIYVRQRNQGIASSRNTGIRKARGELIAFLDGDDLWEPEKLSVQVGVALSHPNSGLIIVDGVEFDDTGITSPTLFFGPYSKELRKGTVTTGSYYRELLHGSFVSTTSQVMVPSRILEIVGLSNNKFKRASDYDLYIRIAAKFDVTIIKKPLTRWRCSSTSASGPKSLRLFRYLPEDIAILKSHLPECAGNSRDFVREIVKEKLICGAEVLYYHGLNVDRITATGGLLRLLVASPFSPSVAAFLVGLWCPRALVSRLKKPVRTMVVGNKGHRLA